MGNWTIARRILLVVGALLLLVLFGTSLGGHGTKVTCSPPSNGNQNAADQTKQAADQFTQPCRLAEIGFYKEAREKLLAVKEAEPQLRVPKELQYLPGGGPEYWRKLAHWYEVRKPFLAALFAGLVVISWITLRTERKPRLDIQDFDNGAAGLEIGKGLSALVEQSLGQLGEGPGGVRMTVVASTIADAELIVPDTKLVSTPLTFASQLVERVFPKRVYTLSGCVQKSGYRGAGLTLTLADKRGMVEENITFWQKDYDPLIGKPKEKNSDEKDGSSADVDPTGYYLLAEPAAVWLYFLLRNRLK
jgi:hypothetical protein